MNFENMPELKWSWGYGFAYAVMAGVVLLSLALMWHMGLIQVCVISLVCTRAYVHARAHTAVHPVHGCTCRRVQARAPVPTGCTHMCVHMCCVAPSKHVSPTCCSSSSRCFCLARHPGDVPIGVCFCASPPCAPPRHPLPHVHVRRSRW